MSGLLLCHLACPLMSKLPIIIKIVYGISICPGLRPTTDLGPYLALRLLSPSSLVSNPCVKIPISFPRFFKKHINPQGRKCSDNYERLVDEIVLEAPVCGHLYVSHSSSLLACSHIEHLGDISFRGTVHCSQRIVIQVVPIPRRRGELC